MTRFTIAGILLLLFFSGLYAQGGSYQQQVEQLQQQIEKSTTAGDIAAEAAAHNKLALLYWGNGNTTEAIASFKVSLAINEKLANQNALRTINSHLGNLYNDEGDHATAFIYYKKALELNQKANKTSEIVSLNLNIANSLQELKKYTESDTYADKARAKALEMNDLRLAAESFEILAANAEKTGNTARHKEYLDQYNMLAKKIQKEEMASLAQKTETYQKEVARKQVELANTLDTLGEVLEQNKEMLLKNELLLKESELRELALKEQEARAKAAQKEKALFGVIAVIIVITLLTIVLLVSRQMRQKKKANQLLTDTNRKIEQQKLEIEKQRDDATTQRKKLTDSIHYAQRIQKAVIPPLESLKESFENFFVFYRPRDIVSGDFYWFSRKDHMLVIAAADCTGHGVPGAFMSMLGVAFLNEIVNKIAINPHINPLSSDLILNELRDKIIESLHQTGNPDEPKDGMDIALCIFDFENRKLQYSGANNPLVIIRNGEILKHKADKMPISYHQKRDEPFTKTVIDLKDEDQVYLFSDGFIDQFGGPKGLKFMARKFENLLLEMHEKPFEKKNEILGQTIDEWKGDHAQLDDMLVIGLEFKAVSKAKVQRKQFVDRTILVAEDTDVNYFLLREVLKTTDAKVIRVKDGVEAVEFIKSNEVSLILMDINMPNMNGYEATKLIKSYRKDIPIIVQTAMNIGDEHEVALAAGADDFISKPIDLKEFLKKIEQFLQ